MKLAIWVSGKLNAQALLNWAAEQKHAPVCLLSLAPSQHGDLPWATANIDALKQAADVNKIDLLFKSVKRSGDENYAALDALLAYAKTTYSAEGVAVSPAPAVAHSVRNAARKLKLKTILLPSRQP